MPDSVAKRKVDSVALAIKNGAIFDSLETKYTTDEAAHRDKGVMTFSSGTIQGEGFAPEFGQFILFDGKPGDKKVIKTSFGWHYIEILDFIKPEMHYNIAYFSKPVEASQETDANASNAANLFAGDSRDQKSFDANSEKLSKEKGINKMIIPNIAPNASQLQGLGASRSFVKSIYDAKTGQVVQPERVGEKYVVAIVTEINKKGTQSAAKARVMVEPLLMNHKKAEIIQKKIGTISTLEAAATAMGGKSIEVADSIRISGTQSPIVASEPKVIGAAFNPANKGKVVPQAIEGSSGVYVVRVDNVMATAVADANVAEQRKTKYQQALMQAQQMYQQMKMQGMIITPAGMVLQEAADIKDNRSKLY